MAARNAVSRWLFSLATRDVCSDTMLFHSALQRRFSTHTETNDSSDLNASPIQLLDRKITGPYKIEQQPLFAVVEVSGTQYKVTPDDLIVTEKISGLDINDTIRLNRVLLLGSKTETVIGRPYVQDASVTAAVEEQFLDGKVIVFKKRRRKNSRRTNGHRQPLTSLRILSVNMPTTTMDL